MKSGSGRRNRASGIVFLEPGLSDRVKYEPLKKKAHLACLALRHLAVLMLLSCDQSTQKPVLSPLEPGLALLQGHFGGRGSNGAEIPDKPPIEVGKDLSFL